MARSISKQPCVLNSVFNNKISISNKAHEGLLPERLRSHKSLRRVNPRNQAVRPDNRLVDGGNDRRPVPQGLMSIRVGLTPLLSLGDTRRQCPPEASARTHRHRLSRCVRSQSDFVDTFPTSHCQYDSKTACQDYTPTPYSQPRISNFRKEIIQHDFRLHGATILVPFETN